MAVSYHVVGMAMVHRVLRAPAARANCRKADGLGAIRVCDGRQDEG